MNLVVFEATSGFHQQCLSLFFLFEVIYKLNP